LQEGIDKFKQKK